MIAKILKKYIFLKDETLGALFKMCSQYEENQVINEEQFKKEDVIFFYMNIQEQLDFRLKERERVKKCKNNKKE